MAAAPSLAGRQEEVGGQGQFLNINFALLLRCGVANAKDEITLHCFALLRRLLLLHSSPSSPSSSLGWLRRFGEYRLRVQFRFNVACKNN